MSPDLADPAPGPEALFETFDRVVLVGNSEEGRAALARLEAEEGRSLFVFFNKTYKVLDGPFRRPALVVARSSAAGANIVYRREVEDVLRPFGGPEFRGILNLRTSGAETLSPSRDFGDVAVAHLDLSNLFSDFYPAGHVPTSGFALAVWLAERMPTLSVRLVGFSARRSARWKLFRDHDWTFEQTAMRLLHRAGRIELEGVDRRELALRRFADRFPEIGREDISGTSAEILGERLGHLEAALDRLVSQTRPLAKIQDLVRRLKPRTRKEKLAASRSKAEEGANPLAKSDGAD